MPIPTLKRSPLEHGFRGHTNFRNAHRILLANHFKSEARYFDTRDFKPGQKSIWHSQPVEEAVDNYKERFSIDAGYKDKHAFLARTSSRRWGVRLVLSFDSFLL